MRQCAAKCTLSRSKVWISSNKISLEAIRVSTTHGSPVSPWKVGRLNLAKVVRAVRACSLSTSAAARSEADVSKSARGVIGGDLDCPWCADGYGHHSHSLGDIRNLCRGHGRFLTRLHRRRCYDRCCRCYHLLRHHLLELHDLLPLLSERLGLLLRDGLLPRCFGL